MIKIIYIAGKVSGLLYHEVSMKFGAYEKQLLNQGHKPIVPLNLVSRGDTWAEAMGKCTTALLQCNELHLLPCWVDSPGARLEKAIAEHIGLPIVYVSK